MTYRLTPAQVRAIRLGYDAGFTQASLAQTYGVSPSHINLICKGKRYKGIVPTCSRTINRQPLGGGRPKGDRKLTREEVTSLLRLRQGGYTYRKLGDLFKIAATTARNYCLERRE
jgi:DNA-binding XRE family transcriptional regulator